MYSEGCIFLRVKFQHCTFKPVTYDNVLPGSFHQELNLKSCRHNIPCLHVHCNYLMQTCAYPWNRQELMEHSHVRHNADLDPKDVRNLAGEYVYGGPSGVPRDERL